MMLAEQYAQALFELVEKDETKGEHYLSHLQKLLARKGHQKLLPNILYAYELIQKRRDRMQKYDDITPEQERTRVLLELYRKLVTS